MTVPEDLQHNTAEMYKKEPGTMCKKRQHDDENDYTNARQSSLELQDCTFDDGDDSTDSVEERSSEHTNRSKKRKCN